MFQAGLKKKATAATLMKIGKPAAASSSKVEEKVARSYVVPKGEVVRDDILCSNGAHAVTILRRFGVAIFPNLLTPPQSVAAFNAVIADVEKLIPTFKYADSKTWPNLRRDGKALHTMLVQSWGVAWMQSVVDIRQNPKIAEFFADVFSAYNPKRTAAQGPFTKKDMLMSADAFSLFLNDSRCSHGWHRPGHYWLHTDKASDDYTTYVQGFINLVDFKADKGVPRGSCLHAMLYSQLYTTTEEYAKLFPWTKGTQFNLIKTQDQIDYLLNKGCKMAYIDAHAGDLVLFLSQTVHEALPAERPHSFSCDTERVIESKRLVIYVACQPRQMATPKTLKKKLEAFEKLNTTGHGAAVGVKTFAKRPRTYGKEEPSVVNPITKYPKLNEQGRSQWAIPDSFSPSIPCDD